jgi:hypothetical protein
MANNAPVTFTWRVVATGGESPGPRSRHGLVFDREAKAIVLVGGIIWDEHETLRSDTWEFRDGHWSQVEAAGPPARHRGAMVYDSRRGCSVLFGGQGNRNDFLGDTWTYADRRWRQWRAWWGRRPAPRCGHSLAFDDEAGVTVLFGGVDRTQKSRGDTWLFDGGSWRPVEGPAPPPRRYAAFAYDPDLKGCVLHGGSEDDHGRRGFRDTWLFRDETWERMASGFDTDVRDDHGLAYHRAARRLVMLEGVGGARGVLVREASGWRPADATPLHPRHQCSPLAWDEGLHGLMFHGGEVRHGGPQFDTTWLLQLSAAA